METVAEKEESKFVVLYKKYQQQMCQLSWFSKLEDYDKKDILIEMAAAASDEYFKGWWEGHSNCYDSLTKRA